MSNSIVIEELDQIREAVSKLENGPVKTALNSLMTTCRLLATGTGRISGDIHNHTTPRMSREKHPAACQT